MVSKALIVSRDEQFAEHLGERLRSPGHWEVTRAVPGEQVRSMLLDRPCNDLLVDLRPESAGPDTANLLRWMGTRNFGNVRVLALSDAGYSRSMVPVIDSIVSKHLRLPLHSSVVEELLHGQRAPLPTMPEQRTLTSGDLRFVTRTPALFSILDEIKQIARHDVTLLLVGETGTGKTFLARFIHELSDRSEERFVTTACGALPPDLIESELFGHVRGAFTSADRNKIGRFEAADRGSLLLDEIDVLALEQQAKLLRVIETGEFEPVGSSETRHSDARLIVASNLDLRQLVEEGRFRNDLFFRLNVLEFRLPPLRERPLDLVIMAMDFIDGCCAQHNVDVDRVESDFLKTIKEYHWPGNIRELKNQMQRAVLLCRNGMLTADLLSLAPRAHDAEEGSGSMPSVTASERTLTEKVAESEKEFLENALRAHNYKRTETAKALGISRVGLYKKMRRHGMITKRKSNSTAQ